MPLILETPDELRWVEEFAELNRFWEELSNGCVALPVESAVSAGTFVRKYLQDLIELSIFEKNTLL